MIPKTSSNSYYSYGAVLETLKQELPLCFKRNGFKQPLKIDIHKDVLAYYRQDKRFTPRILGKVIGLYTKGKAYLKTLQEGADRIDLKGEAVDKVTLKQAEYAKKYLKAKQILSNHEPLERKKTKSANLSNKLSLSNNNSHFRSSVKKNPLPSSSFKSSDSRSQHFNQTQSCANTTTITDNKNKVSLITVANTENPLEEITQQTMSKNLKNPSSEKHNRPIIFLKKSLKVPVSSS